MNWYDELTKLNPKMVVTLAVMPCGTAYRGDYHTNNPDYIQLSDCKIVTGELEDVGKKYLRDAFDDGFGTTYGAYFTAWDDTWVYFPCCYDGAEWIEKVPRNPSPIVTEHVGGG